jgi:hypothetical protein
MTSEMNVLLDRLQEAIDEAISDSSRIGAIVSEMQKSGYDLCLIVESSAAISPIEDTQLPIFVPDPSLMSNETASTGEIELTSDDLAFLQEMNISVAA